MKTFYQNLKSICNTSNISFSDAHNDSYLQFRWARDPSMKVTQLQQFTVTDNIIKGTRIQNYISGKPVT